MDEAKTAFDAFKKDGKMVIAHPQKLIDDSINEDDLRYKKE